MQTRRTKRTRPKRSPIWLSMSDAEFATLVAQSAHIGDVLNGFRGKEYLGRISTTSDAVVY